MDCKRKENLARGSFLLLQALGFYEQQRENLTTKN